MRSGVLHLKEGQRSQSLIRILCLLGIGVAGYLTQTYLAEADPYCGSTHSCADVQNSPYADVVGVPVPVIGLVGYAFLLTLSLLRGRMGEEIDFYLPVLSFGAALIGVLFSAYLTYLEAFVIRAWCYWCMTSALIMAALWVLTVIDLRKVWAEA